ncbi:MAG TPA: DOPA 4,5-dioxygenase family protein [Burkholderiaceae bacterium]|nr:DOPA 4,5-dioxygenase family protein [Burkholderiaceae bacterium]
MPRRPENLFAQYHAHVYFDAETVAQARALCRLAGERFGIRVGRMHERPVGPHPHWSCQLAFDSTQFDGVIAWLHENRNGLDILVHGVTGDDLEDHTAHASWLGKESTLKLEMFSRRG